MDYFEVGACFVSFVGIGDELGSNLGSKCAQLDSDAVIRLQSTHNRAQAVILNLPNGNWREGHVTVIVDNIDAFAVNGAEN